MYISFAGQELGFESYFVLIADICIFWNIHVLIESLAACKLKNEQTFYFMFQKFRLRFLLQFMLLCISIIECFIASIFSTVVRRMTKSAASTQHCQCRTRCHITSEILSVNFFSCSTKSSFPTFNFKDLHARQCSKGAE